MQTHELAFIAHELTKGKDDPQFHLCEPTYKDTRKHEVERFLDTGVANNKFELALKGFVSDLIGKEYEWSDKETVEKAQPREIKPTKK